MDKALIQIYIPQDSVFYTWFDIMRVWVAVFWVIFSHQQAYATSWDWSRGDGNVKITYDSNQTVESDSDFDEVEGNKSSGNLLQWNGNGFSNKPLTILTHRNAQMIARIQDNAAQAIRHESKNRDLDPALLLAIITAESSGDPEAVSHAGAQGLMQLMPGTAKRFDVLDAFNPVQNIRGGAAYLRLLLDRYDDDVWRAVAAYNAGESRIDRGIIPAETRVFADRVVALWINQRMGQAK